MIINLDKESLVKCCGSKKWLNEMIQSAPFKSIEDIFHKSEKIWYSLDTDDWLEAFSHHPKIGDLNSLQKKFSGTKELAGNEQSGINSASADILKELAKLNKDYENKFGYIFIVCASGKSAVEMLDIIKNRINNSPEVEIKIAMEEQNKITKLRLEKLL